MDTRGGVQQTYVQAPPGEFLSLLSVNYILNFQAGLVATEVTFKNLKEFEDEEGKLEALRMDHFYFPIGIWFVGILLSLFFFMAKIIKHRLRKCKTDVPSLTPVSEVENNTDLENIEDTKD